ncbi:hypothetical protein B9Z55_016293 [Caenorhabditis nigoni]|uniref:Uncharacterized protein n=1 Tax=Caenorhabditis nigoni TaxID=1611254 RepID=A0A2G5S9Q2_9PELO|nr:hypothetical protein B9Z55_028949 [Caenorhabditis nigoni]PIC37777.1 hypothetical protein B9Z55_016293 [Caenorhabditis nigoni]
MLYISGFVDINYQIKTVMQTSNKVTCEVLFFHPYRIVKDNIFEEIGKVLTCLDEKFVASDAIIVEIALYSERLSADLVNWLKNAKPFDILKQDKSIYMFIREAGAVFLTSAYQRCKQVRMKMPPNEEFVPIRASLVLCYCLNNSKYLTCSICHKNEVSTSAPKDDDSFETFEADPVRSDKSFNPGSKVQDESDDSFEEFCTVKHLVSTSAAKDDDSFETFEADPVRSDKSFNPGSKVQDESDDSFEEFCTVKHLVNTSAAKDDDSFETFCNQN